MHGAEVCHKHGGAAPQVRRAAARRVAEAQARAAGERFHVDAATPDALGELERLTAITTSFAEFATRQVEALTPAQWAALDPATLARVDVFRTALGEARRLLTGLARLGLTARQIEAERDRYQREVHALVHAMTYRAVMGTLADLGVIGAGVTTGRVRELMARHMAAEAAAITAASDA
jgi:hypothetical protein